MREKNTKTLIISLIKDDLINRKLTSALNDMGLPADHFVVFLSNTIFDLMGFEADDESDQAHELYMQMLKRVKRMNIKDSHVALDALALEIYLMLESKAPKKGAAQLAVVNQKHTRRFSRKPLAAA